MTSPATAGRRVSEERPLLWIEQPRRPFTARASRRTPSGPPASLVGETTLEHTPFQSYDDVPRELPWVKPPLKTRLFCWESPKTTTTLVETP